MNGTRMKMAMDNDRVCVVEFRHPNGDMSKQYLCGMTYERVNKEIETLEQYGYTIVSKHYQSSI